MPKQVKKIAVARNWGMAVSRDWSANDSADYSKIWYNVCGEFKWTKPIHWAGAEEAKSFSKQGYKEGVVASDYELITKNILEYLQSKNIEKLKTQLSTDFIYPGLIKSEYPSSDHTKEDWDEFSYEFYNTRPVIEALFFDRTDLFTAIIDKLVELNDRELFQLVFDSCINTEINARIFLWNEMLKYRITAQVYALKRYGEELTDRKSDADAIKKGDQATKLAQNLHEMLTNKKEEPAFDLLKHQFMNLHFKLSLLKLLHHYDAEFAVHRGLKRFFSNFFIAAFSIGIAQGFHRLATGTCLFFNKTNTQERVEDIHQAIGVFKVN